jgi:Putative Ice-binding-like adhesive domain
MRIRQLKRASEQASVLMVALATAFILGFTLCSYLVLTGAQERSVIRSQRWNAALNLAEAGVEEALAQMNSGTNASGLGYLAGNGWGNAGNVYGPVSRKLSGGTYVVSFMNGATPTIYSTGYVTVPITGDTISRKVKVTALVLPLINVPLGAVNDIDMNGNGAATDSWNSYDTNLSLNGQFDPSRVQSNGSVASVEGVVNIGKHTILGNLYLGPDASYVSSSNQVSGTIYYDYNVQFPDAQLPAGTTWFGAPATTNGMHYFTAANTALYNTFVINDTQPIKVDPGVKVILDVKSTNFKPSSVTILGALTNSGTVTVYQESGTATLSGNSSTPDPGNTRPSAFYYYGLPGVTSITLSGTSTFIGVIYAPEASLTLNGGGNANNLIGSAIVKKVTLNGHYDFHYDESLLTNGPIRGFVPASWQEL